MDNAERVPLRQRLCYSVGHVLNDLCAAMWFSYLLLYLESVNQFSNVMAGYLLLLGQVADALATPLIGYESDHQDGCGKYGKRKSWHVLGTICVMISFPFIFMQCIGCSMSDHWAQFIYYAPFVVIFQFGWASTQISHLSLIPELTSTDGTRVELNAFRYAFTVISNIVVYGLTWALLAQSSTGFNDKIGPADAFRFRDLVLIIVGIGVIFSLIFHVGTREKCLYVEDSGPLPPNDGSTQYRSIHCLTWSDWLKEHQFYMIAVLYMCTRLIVNLSQIYLPMYVMHSLCLPKHYVAVIPLVVYVSGFFISFFMKPSNKYMGKKITYMLGLLCVGGACIWMWFIPKYHTYQMIGAAILLGFGTSTILVTSLAMTADLIGENSKSGAFVYGAMSFTDKLSNGLAVILIQNFHPCKGSLTSCCAACVWYYRHAVVYIPGGVAGLAIIVLLSLFSQTIGRLKYHDNQERDSITDIDATRPLLHSE